jgi:hypothetical protein
VAELAETRLTCSGDPPLFVMVTVIPLLVVATGTFPNPSVGGASEAVGTTPVPDNVTACVEPLLLLSLKIMVPGIEPGVPGLKATFSGHKPLAGIGECCATAQSKREFYRCRAALPTGSEIKINLLGPGNPDVALTEQNLGGQLHRLGRSEEAVPLLQSAVAVLKARLIPGHPTLLIALANLRQAGEVLDGI